MGRVLQHLAYPPFCYHAMQATNEILAGNQRYSGRPIAEDSLNSVPGTFLTSVHRTVSVNR